MSFPPSGPVQDWDPPPVSGKQSPLQAAAGADERVCLVDAGGPDAPIIDHQAFEDIVRRWQGKVTEIDETLRSEEPLAPSEGFTQGVMEAVALEKGARPRVARLRLALLVGALLLLLMGTLALVALASGGQPAAETTLPTVLSRLHPNLEWVVTSGRRLLVATLALAIVLLVVRRAERTVSRGGRGLWRAG
jgi:hypothetical protein